MTTKPMIPVAVDDPPYTDENGVFYPETDGEPLPDGFEQESVFLQVMPVLRTYFKSRREAIVSGDTFMYYEQGNPQVRIAPDCYVALGVTDEAILPYNSYLTWHVGKVPDFALEIASRGTARQDLEDKRELYAEIGIGEYWRYDATPDSAYYGEPLVGEQLVDGRYVRLPVQHAPDGQVQGHSPVLALDLCWQAGRLLFFSPATGEYLRDLDEAEDAREQAEVDRRRESVARQQAEDALQLSESARERAEAEAAQLREQVRRLRGEM